MVAMTPSQPPGVAGYITEETVFVGNSADSGGDGKPGPQLTFKRFKGREVLCNVLATFLCLCLFQIKKKNLRDTIKRNVWTLLWILIQANIYT